MPRIRVPARPSNNQNGFQPNGFSPLDNFFLGVGVLFQICGLFLAWIGKPPYFLLTFLFLGLYYLALLTLKLFINLRQMRVKLNVPRPKVHTKIPLPRASIRLPHFRLPHLPSFHLPRLHVQIPSLPFPRISGSVFRFLLLSFAFLASFAIPWFYVFKDLPKASELTNRSQELSTRIYDRNGTLLYKFYKEENRTLLKLNEIPLFARQATIAIEDADFYSHTGFSFRGIARAVVRNTTRGETTGGSTITQQLVKNALLSPEKTLSRKAKELVLAVQTELHYPKDQILEMYMNEIAFGGNTYGIEEASQTYFGKSAKDLTLGESALLAGLPKAPTTYSPFGVNPTLAKARQYEVLSRMVQQGYITQLQAEEAINQELVYAPQRTDIKAPHFVMYVKQLLAEKYGEQAVEQGGLNVITSLDLNIQENAQAIVADETAKIKNLGISNGAAMVTDPETGEILAMVGSRDYFDAAADGNFNVATALRQPGSSIKPLNYAYGIESKRYTAASLISDSPIVYHTRGSEPYAPRNYDNRFRGNVTLRTSLASSLNVPAVKVLASYGVTKMIEQGTRMGITTWTSPERYGLSLTLGGGEVKLSDMTVLYGTFANYGKTVRLVPILSVTDSKGVVLEDKTCAEKSSSIVSKLISKVYAAEAPATSPCSYQSLDERVAYIITDILKDNAARTPAFGPNSLLNIPGHTEVAVKTGTTQNLRDNWAIGYTKDYVVAAWVGNNDNTPMRYVASGITGATPIWHNIMKGLLADKPVENWHLPAGISSQQICPTTGTLPCEGCGGKTEYFLPGTEPTAHCVVKSEEEKKAEDEARQNGEEPLPNGDPAPQD